jgi:hypothetical protein
MENAAVHRLVEEHAASHSDSPAIVCGGNVATYRDLNFKANAVARHLLDAGFCRGGHAMITLAPGIDLAAVLLGVLKSGGAYTWLGSPARVPGHIAIARHPEETPSSHQPIDLTSILTQALRPGPNLPILTRPGDIACVLPGDIDAGPVLVPHSTIAALRRPGLSAHPRLWEGDRTTFDLWIGLMAGTTLSVETAPALMSAA